MVLQGSYKEFLKYMEGLNMKKTVIIRNLTIAVFTLLVMLVVMFPTKTFASKKCVISGCNRSAYGSGSYCNTHTCVAVACNNKKASGSSYCSSHKSYSSKNTSKKSSTSTKKKSSSKSSSKSSKNSSKKKSYYDSYDDGYEAVWLNDDYDWDRYWRDDDYASGVDDAMEDYDW